MKRIIGIKKAVGEYNRANAGGIYDPSYGMIMLDTSTGEVWCDTFCDLGHNSFNDYHDEAIICLSDRMKTYDYTVNMASVRKCAYAVINDRMPAVEY